MRTLFTFLILGYAFLGSAQQFVLDKGKDTLRSVTKDTIITIQYKLKGLSLNSKPKIQIKFDSGTATIGKDFNLLDCYNSETNQIDISKVENTAGSFKIQIAGDVTEPKTINLQVVINDNGAIKKDFIKLILMPPSKKPEEESKKSETKESIEFFVSTKSKIPAFKINSASNEEKVKEVDISLDPEISQQGKQDYRIRINTTDNEVYFGTIKLTTQFEFPNDDKLYLKGKSDEIFIHARDIFLITHIVESDKRKKAEDNIIKFKL